MNETVIKGTLKDITYSHNIGDVSYSKALLISENDEINLKFKSCSNKYKENDEVELKGNLRSYSHKGEDDKYKVCIYVFTYFDDLSEEEKEKFKDIKNAVNIDGRICKLNELRTTKKGNKNIHFILANNLIYNNGHKRLNSYIPCIAWGKVAEQISQLNVSDKIIIHGEIHSHQHKVNNNEQVTTKTAHELYVKSFEVIE